MGRAMPLELKLQIFRPALALVLDAGGGRHTHRLPGHHCPKTSFSAAC